MKIVISMGDCNGIGIEVMIEAIMAFDKQNNTPPNINFTIVGNSATIIEYLSCCNSPVLVESGGIYIKERFCPIIECANFSEVQFGENTLSAGALAAEAIEIALERTISREFDAMLTMPVSKESLYLAGWKFPGHTEMLAERCGVSNPLMILCDKQVRVALATIHTSLSKVPEALTKESIELTLQKFNKSLKSDYGIDYPNIAVLGLNPHAGENSAIGNEEVEIITPAIKASKDNGIKADGPFPADGFFAHGEYHKYDGILAMYHDQGLIPLKMLAKGAGVNYTAGLPIVRTSPDHGTAFAIAGKHKADYKSSLNAIELAIEISQRRKKSS